MKYIEDLSDDHVRIIASMIYPHSQVIINQINRSGLNSITVIFTSSIPNYHANLLIYADLNIVVYKSDYTDLYYMENLYMTYLRLINWGCMPRKPYQG